MQTGVDGSEFVARDPSMYFCYGIHTKCLLIRPFFHKPPSDIRPTRDALGVASNNRLVIALAIECKRCHLPTNNIE